MKCVLLIASDQITRLNNEFAARLVAQGQAHYISKAEWKALLRKGTTRHARTGPPVPRHGHPPRWSQWLR